MHNDLITMWYCVDWWNARYDSDASIQIDVNGVREEESFGSDARTPC